MSTITPDKPNSFYLKNEFITWLKEDQDYTPGSANSYASYVSAANKNILTGYLKEDSFFDLIREAASQLAKYSIEELIDRLVGVVIEKAEAAVLYKYKNGLIQYRNFLIETLSEDEIIDDAEPLKTVIATSVKENKAVYLKNDHFPDLLTYDKDALKKIFTFRMVTQDRCYGNVYFLVSFLKKLFYKDMASRIFFNGFIENQINNIQLHTNRGTIALADIKALTIEAVSDQIGVTVVLDDDSNSILYTKMGIGDDQPPMKTIALRSIAIDHIFPMKLILEEQEAVLPALKRVTQAFKSFQGVKPNGRVTGKMIKEIGNQLLNANVFKADDLQQLKQEMNHIASFIELQLMDGAENLLKKATFAAKEEKKSAIA